MQRGVRACACGRRSSQLGRALPDTGAGDAGLCHRRGRPRFVRRAGAKCLQTQRPRPWLWCHHPLAEQPFLLSPLPLLHPPRRSWAKGPRGRGPAEREGAPCLEPCAPGSRGAPARGLRASLPGSCRRPSSQGLVDSSRGGQARVKPSDGLLFESCPSPFCSHRMARARGVLSLTAIRGHLAASAGPSLLPAAPLSASLQRPSSARAFGPMVWFVARVASFRDDSAQFAVTLVTTGPPRLPCPARLPSRWGPSPGLLSEFTDMGWYCRVPAPKFRS